MDDTFDITYKALFRRYYPNLMFYATRLVGDEEAEDVVQDVFVELWKRRDSMVIGDQIQAFLYRGGIYPGLECAETSQHRGRILRCCGRNQPKTSGILSAGQQRSNPADRRPRIAKRNLPSH